ncbi:precorrin-2 C(20)-methyltransferase [Aminiphilus circumscriptus]|jgi:precorrin-2/cobalt-factor-2 C20-methyltransferase|uniref:precorrin-2 C(20)-methyltransferase n=1 Tax=Aminiphilus circumscriptus TaxID=290732 RepID=UPI00047867C1|nr:precorrin-2 C(20)-methyltransferase [Aminiphilus circumscriptus]
MILYGIGVGPGDPELVTLKALRLLEEADLVLVPVSRQGRASVAGDIVTAAWAERSTPLPELVPLVFPMVRDEEERRRLLEEQLRMLRPRWEGARAAALPVLGDAALYATVAWLFEAWRPLAPELELRLVPGISAHSFAACALSSFLALAEERLAVVPCTAGADEVRRILEAADTAALYKPSALGKDLARTVSAAGPWKHMVRIERGGLPEERILQGEEAISPCSEYLSLVLLWRERASV